MAEKNNEEMSDELFVVDVSADPEAGIHVVGDTMEALFETASVERVYGSPTRRGDYTIIPAAEVLVGAGFGVGFGSGEGPADEAGEVQGSGTGGGGGGGGRTLSRPVAVIVNGPDGVRVEPVVDVTKIGLAAITAFGFMLSTLMRMKRGT